MPRPPPRPAPRLSSTPADNDQVVVGILFKAGVDLSRVLVPPRRGPPGGAATGAGSALRKAIELLEAQGFRVSGVGLRTLSVRGAVKAFRAAFGAELEARSDAPDRWGRLDLKAKGIQWSRFALLANVVEAIEIQRPFRFLDATSTPAPSATPPVLATPVMNVRGEVSSLIRGQGQGREMGKGGGVPVAMVDSGFDCRHGFFTSKGLQVKVRLAEWASNEKTDPDGHGTAMCANFLAVAPEADLVGVKLLNDEDPSVSATALEGIQRAVRLRPRPWVVSMSKAIDLKGASVDGDCLILKGEIEAHANHPDPAKRIVFVFSAGNDGDFGFPAQMPDVIAVGGVFSDRSGGTARVADFSSAFTSNAFPGRTVPDVSGVLGLWPDKTDLMLPVPSASAWDVDRSPADGTSSADGWAVFGGTSATAPQVAAVCALLLEKHPDLSPDDIKQLLMSSAIAVLDGSGAVDGDAGAGVVNAAAALKLAKVVFP